MRLHDLEQVGGWLVRHLLDLSHLREHFLRFLPPSLQVQTETLVEGLEEFLKLYNYELRPINLPDLYCRLLFTNYFRRIQLCGILFI